MAENNKHNGDAAHQAEIAVSSSGQCNAIDLAQSFSESFFEYIQSINGAATLSSIAAIVTVLAFTRGIRFPYAKAVSNFGFVMLTVLLGISALTKASDTASFKLVRSCLDPQPIVPPQTGSQPKPAPGQQLPIKHTLKLHDRIEVAGEQTLNSQSGASLNETTVYKERQVRRSLQQSPTIHGNESVHVKTSVKRFCHRLPQGP